MRYAKSRIQSAHNHLKGWLLEALNYLPQKPLLRTQCLKLSRLQRKRLKLLKKMKKRSKSKQLKPLIMKTQNLEKCPKRLKIVNHRRSRMKKRQEGMPSNQKIYKSRRKRKRGQRSRSQWRRMPVIWSHKGPKSPKSELTLFSYFYNFRSFNFSSQCIFNFYK